MVRDRNRSQHCSWSMVAAVLVGIVGVLGCEVQTRRPTSTVPTKELRMTVDSAQDHLLMAMEFLDDFHKYDERENLLRIHYHLGKWIEGQSADDDWVADPMFSRLPSRLNLTRNVAALSRLELNDMDMVMLREAIWLRDVARQLADREVSDPDLRVWLERLELNHSAERDLANVIEVFDWTVRNIQLEGFQAARRFAESAGVDPPIGETFRQPWEAMLIGRGDVWVRAQVMMLVARQLGVPMVVLAIDGESEPRPWALAALIDKQLYLFDPRFGLPIPGPGGVGIATFNDVLGDPELLRQLDQENRPYGVGGDELQRVVALVEASFSYLTQKMALLELALPSKYKLRLTIAPSQLAQQLRQLPGITNVAIWTAPYDVINYRTAHREDARFLMALGAISAPFSGDNALANGRRLHLRGDWTRELPMKGAKAYYMDCRVPDTRIESLVFDETLLSVLGIDGPLPNDPEFLEQFRMAQAMRLRFFKRHASYWLGIMVFEEGMYDVAIDFFQKRSLDPEPDGVFADGARYALARSYEQQGRLTRDDTLLRQAIEIYESDQSPQRLGNRIRAARLRNLIAADA